MPNPTILQTVQYLRDLSFENFAVNASPGGQPALDVNVNVGMQPIGTPAETNGTVTGEYESGLMLRATARSGNSPEDKPLFVVEVAFVGRYRIADVPKTEAEQFLLIEAPRLLFPFVRQIVADSVAHGGLPPLLLAPIDFAQIYQQRQSKA